MFLIEANIVNLDQLDDFLHRLASEVNSDIGKKFVTNKLKKWITQNDEFSQKVPYKPGMPLWAEKVAAGGGDLHEFKPSQHLRDEIGHIVDFIKATELVINAPAQTEIEKEKRAFAVKFLNDSIKMSTMEDAKNLANKWFAFANRHVSDDEDLDGIEVIYRFSNKYTIVKIKTFKALQREGKLAGNCVAGGSYDQGIFRGDTWMLSLRDELNNPHVTCLVKTNREPKEIDQIQGLGNSNIAPKYQHLMNEFLNHFKIVPGGNALSKLKWNAVTEQFVDNDLSFIIKEISMNAGTGWAETKRKVSYAPIFLSYAKFQDANIAYEFRLNDKEINLFNRVTDTKTQMIDALRELLSVKPNIILSESFKAHNLIDIVDGKVVKVVKKTDENLKFYVHGKYKVAEELKLLKNNRGEDYTKIVTQFLVEEDGEWIALFDFIPAEHYKPTTFDFTNEKLLRISLMDPVGLADFLNHFMKSPFVNKETKVVLPKVLTTVKKQIVPIYEKPKELDGWKKDWLSGSADIHVYEKTEKLRYFASKTKNIIYAMYQDEKFKKWNPQTRKDYTTERPTVKWFNPIWLPQFLMELNKMTHADAYKTAIEPYALKKGYTLYLNNFVKTEDLHKEQVLEDFGTTQAELSTPSENGVLINKFSLVDKTTKEPLIEIKTNNPKEKGAASSITEISVNGTKLQSVDFPAQAIPGLFMLINAGKIPFSRTRALHLGYYLDGKWKPIPENSPLSGVKANHVKLSDDYYAKIDSFYQKYYTKIGYNGNFDTVDKSGYDWVIYRPGPDGKDEKVVSVNIPSSGNVESIQYYTGNRKTAWKHVTELADIFSMAHGH